MEPQQSQEPQPSPPAAPSVHVLGRALVDFLAMATDGKKKSDWKPPPGWIWGLAPILFAAFKVLLVSHGDPEVLRALVQNLNVTALVLATVLPFGAVIAVPAALGSILWAKRSRGQVSDRASLLMVALLITAICLTLWAVPVWQFGAFIGFVVVVVMVVRFAMIFINLWRQRTPTNDSPGKPAILLALVIVVALLAVPCIYLGYLIGGSGMWLPQERITFAGRTANPVYILSSDQRWTSYLDEGRKVHLVPTANITDRDAVGSSGSWLDKSVADNTIRAVTVLAGWVRG